MWQWLRVYRVSTAPREVDDSSCEAMEDSASEVDGERSVRRLLTSGEGTGAAELIAAMGTSWLEAYQLQHLTH